MERLENNLKTKGNKDEEYLSFSLFALSFVLSVIAGVVCLVLDIILGFKFKKNQRGLIFLGVGAILLAIRYFLGGLTAETLFEIPVVKELYSIIDTLKTTFHFKASWSWLTTLTLFSIGLSTFSYGLSNFNSTENTRRRTRRNSQR